MDKDLTSIYIQQLNDYLLPSIDFVKLDISCNSSDTAYAIETLKSMHDVLEDVYGTTELDESYGTVIIPAVIHGRDTGKLAISLVMLDLESSGEHWGTYMMTPLGIIEQGNENNSPNQSQYLNEQLIPYDYWYTAEILSDIHMDTTESRPLKVAELLSACGQEPMEIKMQ